MAVAYGVATPFDAAREVLETKCLECHTTKEKKGGLIFVKVEPAGAIKAICCTVYREI